MLKNKALIAPLGLVWITILSGVFSMSSITSATDNADAVDDVSITVPVSCSMEGTGMNSHNANIVNGTYQADIGSTTLKAFCNDTNGFAIYAAGYTGDEIGGTNSTKLVGTNGNIVTGTATSGSTSNWAMKLATNSGATYPLTLDNSFGSYSAVPASYTKVAHRDSGTDIGTTATGASLTTTYAAYVNQTQPAGTYAGKVIYTLVHPSSEVPAQPIACEGGKICYNPNTATALGQMGKQTPGNSEEVTLYASNFSRTGYGFAGWNTEYDYSGTTYGPNETITTPADTSTNGLSLYAVWVPSAGTLQNWNGCSSLTQGAVTALTDLRDNDTYAVAKLADGKCWMIENLRLENTGTDNANGSLAQGYNSSFIGLAAPESANFGSTTANSLYSINGSTDATISGSYQGYRFPRYNNYNTNSRQSSSSYSASDNTYSYGNYYTWPASIADTTSYSINNQSVEDTSLCPAGWHLPRGGDKSNEVNNEFWNLIVTGLNNGVKPANYNNYTTPYYSGATEGAPVSNALRSYPNNFLYSGELQGSSVFYRNTSGYYLSSTALNDYFSYYMFFAKLIVDPGSNNEGRYKSDGLSIRCVLDFQ
ncbi:hypothetical protein IKF87_01070 [Candidatus Saccharibacteria bacterium]|nr:hypothetical protein [Candidatus Saccharibacteria bacterium]